jgi:hypothetical protein
VKDTDIDTRNVKIDAPSDSEHGGSVRDREDIAQESIIDGTAEIWQNPNVIKVINKLLSGEITRIEPQIDLSIKDGFSYPDIDYIIQAWGGVTYRILESLAADGIIVREDYEKILVSPGGSLQLIPVERCPNCDSLRISEGKMIEHFACGHVGIEEEFVSGTTMVCPKCKKELKLIGTDYRMPGLRYSCQNCHDIFPLPEVKYRCLETGKILKLEELRHIWLYSYRLNEARRQRLEFELEPKRQFVEWLHGLGYSVREAVEMKGKSGAMHTVDLLATMEDPIAKHAVAIGILAAPHGEEAVDIDSLFKFDSKIYDIGFTHKIVLAVPRLVPEAVKFAERQGIRVYSMEELRKLLSQQPAAVDIVVDKKGRSALDSMERSEFKTLGLGGWLKWLLERVNYQVTGNAKISGRSGASHIIELLAQKDDGIVNHRLAACVIDGTRTPEDIIDKVVQFDAAAYDAGISSKVIIAVPCLSEAAGQFAEYQRTKVLEAEDLDQFYSKYLAPGQEPISIREE